MGRVRIDRKPIFCRVRTQERRVEVAEICDLYGWYFMIDVVPDKPEDITELEWALDVEVRAAEMALAGT